MLLVNSEMQRRVLWAGLARGLSGPAGSAWCESPAGGRVIKGHPLLPWPAWNPVIPWPHSEAGREASMLGNGILGDHRWEAQLLL